MSDANFTEGEWVADIRSGCCAVYEKTIEDDTHCLHYDDDRNIHYSRCGAKYNGNNWEMSKEAIANCYLIAAAPEMYELLNLISNIDHCKSGSLGSDGQFYYKVSESVFNKVDNLLAKLRGEQC